MAADLIELSEAVKDALQAAVTAGEFGPGAVTVSRAWDIDFDRKNLTGQLLKVVPVDESKERIDDITWQVDVFVVGTYAAKLTGPVNDAAIDEHVSRLAAMRDWFLANNPLDRESWVIAIDDVAIPDRKSIQKDMCVWAVWVWTFREERDAE